MVSVQSIKMELDVLKGACLSRVEGACVEEGDNVINAKAQGTAVFFAIRWGFNSLTPPAR
jgi:hypothetical protein